MDNEVKFYIKYGCWIFILILFIFMCWRVTIHNMEKGEVPKPVEIKHYEDTRDAISNAPSSSNYGEQYYQVDALQTVVRVIPIFAILLIIFSVLNCFLRWYDKY